MNEAKAFASLKVPRLLIVPPFQNWIALLLAAVLPLQVVLPRARRSVRRTPPSC
jgi:hypothetical protein